jgi:peptidoglycan/xylan/chitin deacetylase (PgdA/CDA1 family)
MAGGALMGGSAAILAAGAGMAYAVRGRSSSVFGPSVYHGDRGRKSLALTFDDGPSEATPALLELLAKFGVRSTFFMCGSNVERLPEVAKAVAAAGHEIGNHSNTHPRFHFCSQAFMYRELAETQRKIADATGVSPKLFRAPYGVRWFGLGAAQKRLNLLGVMWTIIGRDWRWPAARISALLTGRARGGDIICLHDGRGVERMPNVDAMLTAVADAVPRLQRAGFRFETVSEILRPAN